MRIRTLALGVALLSIVGASPQQKTYTVRKGDTLTQISKALGIKLEVLTQANGLTAAQLLRPGQTLVVPTDASSAPKDASNVETISNPQAQAAVESVELYAGMSAGSKAIGKLEKGAKAIVLREAADWTKLQIGEDIIAWAPTALLEISPPSILETAPPAFVEVAPKPVPKRVVAVAKSKSVSAEALLDRANSYKGVRYRYGGTSRSGVDCSGFTSSVYRAEGVSLPRTAIQQSRVGARVSKDALKAGDLVFFKTRGHVRVSHVGIYVGDGKFIHAPSTGGRVRQDALTDGYYAKRYAGARRVADVKSALVAKKSADD